MEKQSVTKRLNRGLAPFTDEQFAKRKKKKLMAKKSRKINRR